jgi:hypothetical protein
MPILKPVLILLSLFNYMVSQDQAAQLFYETEFIGEYDEDLKYYENTILQDPVQTGGYKLCYFDNNINYQLVFYDNKPLVCSVKIGDCNAYIKEIEAIDSIVAMLGYKSSTYSFLMDETAYYVKHIYARKLTFLIVDSWLEENYSYIWMFTAGKHPLNYRPPRFDNENE